MNQCYLHEAMKLNNVQLTLKIMDTCVPEAQSSSLARIAFNTPAIFFLEFLILGMMYTQLAGDVTWRESLPSPIYFLILNYHISVSHSEGSQARSLHACWTRMVYHDRLETIDNSPSTNPVKTLKIFNVYTRKSQNNIFSASGLSLV